VDMNDGSGQDHPLPLFLTDRIDATEQQGSSRIFKTAILVLTVSAIGAAVLTFGDPLTRLAAVTASLVDASPPQPDNPQPAPTIQSAADVPASSTIPSTADVQAQPAPVADVPTRQETTRQETTHQEIRQDVAAASEPVVRPQTETSESSSDALFRQFQAWSQEQDSRQAPAQVAQAQPAEPVQSTQGQSEPDSPAAVRTARKHRHVRATQNARAETRSARNPQPRALRTRSAPARTRAVEDARAQDLRAQNAQAPQQAQPAQSPSFFQMFGWQ
jgi:hypothetical protein